MAQSASTGPRLSFQPIIELDPSTQTFAAWCDELCVATSARTPEEARLMLADAMVMAAAFTVQHKKTLRWDLLAQLPYAEMIHGRSLPEIMAIIDGNLQLRTDRTGA